MAESNLELVIGLWSTSKANACQMESDCNCALPEDCSRSNPSTRYTDEKKRLALLGERRTEVLA